MIKMNAGLIHTPSQFSLRHHAALRGVNAPHFRSDATAFRVAEFRPIHTQGSSPEPGLPSLATLGWYDSIPLGLVFGVGGCKQETSNLVESKYICSARANFAGTF